ncbi:MAG: septal ring lytic transglycosylase RlpA family protein [Candidatus Komeilibacteria bacterium]|nr:septal ring lytic transglycosylase RlpA family protein [Candidatus Komeilibacteria bacterium]
MIHKKIVAVIILLMFAGLATVAQAVTEYAAHLTATDIADGAYLGSPDDMFHVSFPAKTYSQDIDVYLSDTSVDQYPTGNRIGGAYSYYIFAHEEAAVQFELALRFESDTPLAKHLWRYDYLTEKWEKLPTRVDWAGKLAIATTSHHYGKIALIEEPAQLITNGGDKSVVNAGPLTFKTGTQDWQTLALESYNQHLYEEKWERLSDIYQYDLKTTVGLSQPLILEWDYMFTDFKMPTAFYWDKTRENWIELVTLADMDRNKLIITSPFTYARVALFQKTDTWIGEASWYRYKGCSCAASRDYPKGTKLKVTHLSTGRSAVVTVNDYGPELWTGRVIDLDATVYEQFISLRSGVTDVKIELHD